MQSLSAKAPFDYLLFYYDLLLHPEDFCFILVVGGGRWMVGGGPLFGSLNLLIIIWYIVQVYIYFFIQKESVQIKSRMGFKFWRSWRPDQLNLKLQFSGQFLKNMLKISDFKA